MNLKGIIENKMSKHLCIYNQNMKLLSLYLYKEGLCSENPIKLSLASLKYLFIFWNL